MSDAFGCHRCAGCTCVSCTRSTLSLTGVGAAARQQQQQQQLGTRQQQQLGHGDDGSTSAPAAAIQVFTNMRDPTLFSGQHGLQRALEQFGATSGGLEMMDRCVTARPRARWCTGSDSAHAGACVCARAHAQGARGSTVGHPVGAVRRMAQPSHGRGLRPCGALLALLLRAPDAGSRLPPPARLRGAWLPGFPVHPAAARRSWGVVAAAAEGLQRA
jgi:hypothetical protein